MNAFHAWVQSVGGAAQAADLLNVTPDAIYKWLKGHRLPRPAMAEKIERISGGAVPRASLLWPAPQEAA
jgi:DNA-binding transcriptional regulator YdaS (Cro superfamily)